MENTVRVNIAGVEYALKTDESVEMTQQLAKEINLKINEVKASNPYISTSQIAILMALEYGCSCKKAEANTEKLRAEMKSYLEDAANAQSERDFYKRELERLKEDARARTNQTSLFDDNK